MQIDKQLLTKLGVAARTADNYLVDLNRVLPEYGIDTPLRVAHFLAQLIVESGGMQYVEYTPSFTAKQLLTNYPKQFSAEQAESFAQNPEKLANRLYENRFGNDDEASGDGFRYRGRGFFLIQGKQNYRELAKWLGDDVLEKPDLVASKYAVHSAVFKWDVLKLNDLADKDDIKEITRILFGPNAALERRLAILEEAKRLLGLSDTVSGLEGATHRVTARTLNIRTQPNTQSPKLGTLSQETEVILMSGADAPGWAHVGAVVDGRIAEGFVSKRYLKPIQQSEEENKAPAFSTEPIEQHKPEELPEPPLVFISYNPEDQNWLDRLIRHLNSFVDQGVFRIWHRGMLGAEDDEDRKTQEVLQSASAVVPLISPNYLNSEADPNRSFSQMLNKSEEKELLLRPLIVEPCQWKKESWIDEKDVYPSGGRGLLLFSEKEIDDHLDFFAAEVARLFDEAAGKSDENDTTAVPQPEQNVPTHLDDPSKVDLLNRRPFAEAIAVRIKDIHKMEHHEKLAGVEDKPKKEKGSGPSAESEHPDQTLAVHIHGPWGSGKSTVLNFMREELESGDPDVPWVVINFNAWRHERLKPPWWSLIRQIYMKGSKRLGELKDYERRRKVRFRWFFWRLRADWLPILIATVMLLFIVVFVGGSMDIFNGTGAGGGNETTPGNFIEPILKIITMLLAAWAGIVALGRSLLFGSSKAAQSYMEISRDPLSPVARLFEKLVKGIGHPVAIFIDDLDRCREDYVVELLEGIQTLFRRAKATYVVTADRDWICTSFERKYENFAESVAGPGRPLGSLFLEKIFQISASLPKMSSATRKTYWSFLLRTAESLDAEKLDQAARNAEKDAEQLFGDADTQEEFNRVITRYDQDPVKQMGLRAVAAKRLSTLSAQKKTEHLLQPYAHLLEPNPRAMKRLVNAFGIHQAINFLEHREVENGPLALWTIIELRWPLIADCLADYPALVSKVSLRSPPKDRRIPEALRELFVSKDLKAVVNGKGIKPRISLTKEIIEQIVGSEPG